MTSRLLREPLLHFLAAGAFIFVAYALFGGGRDDTHTITVSDGQIGRLQQVFAAQWRREPTVDELNGLVESYIEEEILYREALALGLDKDDTIVRRRLAQKMQFLIEDTAAPSEPTEADLEAYFDAHKDDFQLPVVLSFTHVYFSADRRTDAEGDARAQLAQLAGLDRAPDHGDAFMLRYAYADVTQGEIARLFGREFATALFALPEGTDWQGPIRSGYGFHLVRIASKTTPPPPTFAGARDGVLAAYLDAERRRLNTETLSTIKARYRIVMPPPSQS
jgi:hypothetical protein